MRRHKSRRTLAHTPPMGRDGQGPITRIERFARRVCVPVQATTTETKLVTLTEATAKARLLERLRRAGKMG